jgi:hypothetical protein
VDQRWVFTVNNEYAWTRSQFFSIRRFSAVCLIKLVLAAFSCARLSQHSHARINPSAQRSDVARGSRSRALLELTLIEQELPKAAIF